jgi:hypothetical protein
MKVAMKLRGDRSSGELRSKHRIPGARIQREKKFRDLVHAPKQQFGPRKIIPGEVVNRVGYGKEIGPSRKRHCHALFEIGEGRGKVGEGPQFGYVTEESAARVKRIGLSFRSQS